MRRWLYGSRRYGITWAEMKAMGSAARRVASLRGSSRRGKGIDWRRLIMVGGRKERVPERGLGWRIAYVPWMQFKIYAPMSAQRRDGS